MSRPANSAASSPPAPGRISRMTLRSSFSSWAAARCGPPGSGEARPPVRAAPPSPAPPCPGPPKAPAPRRCRVAACGTPRRCRSAPPVAVLPHQPLKERRVRDDLRQRECVWKAQTAPPPPPTGGRGLLVERWIAPALSYPCPFVRPRSAPIRHTVNAVQILDDAPIGAVEV